MDVIEKIRNYIKPNKTKKKIIKVNKIKYLSEDNTGNLVVRKIKSQV